MKFAIITHVPHGIENQKFYAYSPYVKEMNIWIKHFDELIIVAPLYLKTKTSITHEYQKDNVDFRVIRQFNFLNIFSIIKSVIYLPKVCLTIFIAMKNADHIHLRCPGNVGLLACFIQILFPAKSKTAKYAGNWDANAKQPLSYKLQKWLLNNKFITKKMQVLVYGEWKKTTKNIKPFFTASYYEIEKKEIEKKTLKNKISFVFVGTLSIGKQPLYALMIINELIKKGYNVELSFYGEGVEKEKLKTFIKEKNIQNFIFLKGNQTQEIIKEAFITSHFVILPSKSEGWPKVIAEGMFWKCLPIATSVSCIPNMLDNENRGVLLEMILDTDIKKIEKIINNEELYNKMNDNAMHWSRKYTIDYFEHEIKKILAK